METIKKQTIKVGNSAGVLLPKEWMNSVVEVRLVKTPYSQEKIYKDLYLYLKDYFKNILGVYLIGSYARNDYDEKSDVDILVITDSIDKIININDYEIFLVSVDNLRKRLSKSLYLISAIKEAITLMNPRLLNELKGIDAKININEHEKEIKSMLKINKDMIDSAKEQKEKVLDGTAYSLVLRFRELYLIKCIIHNKKPDKKEFLRLIGKNIYYAYLRVKRNQEEKNDVDTQDADNLYNLTIKWLKDLKEQNKG